MIYEVLFRKEALQDILEAIAWYEKNLVGLGDEFLIAVENEIHLIEQNPYLFEDKYKGIRKVITNRFPYIIYYRIESEKKVLIFAVLHMSRNPKILEKRHT
ncbi:MAG: type II toxin-antitoxin system RelE/ParE family toxin [Bacteroidales bacterium]|nr:type II toxin-antitoxin system RelE/ParE family toxin [Bacteroidales bacterium]MCB8999529.1 type II toxin-antitoxin system RelE/ParE family toxin [Bacteroidales bacterium]MCB9012950.1 type II toxin-antitoxin system RelE/ParE family toxin [Bacteroidales bacterium]